MYPPPLVEAPPTVDSDAAETVRGMCVADGEASFWLYWGDRGDVLEGAGGGVIRVDPRCTTGSGSGAVVEVVGDDKAARALE